MNGVFFVGATGLRAQQVALDVIANNLANINTPAFKRSGVVFAELVSGAPTEAAPTGAARQPARAGAGVQVATAQQVFTPGEIRRTENNMDVAVRGAGFIEVLGPGGQIYLWRGGGLRVNADGFLAAANGMQLKAQISIPRDAQEIAISDTGRVLVAGGDERRAREIGQIDLVGVADTRALEPAGDGLYRVRDELIDITRARAGEEGLGVLAQGAVETSNVRLTDEMVSMMLLQRAYAANARLIQTADELMNLTNGLRR